MSRPSDIRFTQEYALYRPKEQIIYPISQGEWNRIKERVKRIPPHNRVFEILALQAAQLAISAFFAILAFITAKDVPAWIWHTYWIIFVGSLVLSPSLYFIDKLHEQGADDLANNVVDEMEYIEQKFHTPTSSMQESFEADDAINS